jgi:Zn-dependent protease
VFNLLPFYPLDGFRIVDATVKRRGKVYWFLRQYGYYILMGMILISFLSNRISLFAYIDVLGYMMNFATNVLGKPITLLWNWVLDLLL